MSEHKHRQFAARKNARRHLHAALYEARVAAAIGGVLSAVTFALGALYGFGFSILRGRATAVPLGSLVVAFGAYVAAGTIAGGVIGFGIRRFRSTTAKYLCAALGGAIGVALIGAGLPGGLRGATGMVAPLYGAALGLFGLFIARRTP